MTHDQARRTTSGGTVSQLKREIDVSHNGETLLTGDQGLSPLGTDDEAGGFPNSREKIGLARRQEAAIGATAAAEGPSPSKYGRFGPILVMVAAIAVMAFVIGVLVITKG